MGAPEDREASGGVEVLGVLVVPEVAADREGQEDPEEEPLPLPC